MSTILGLDLGTNSIGWSLIDTQLQSIIATGVRIFPEGVNRDNKGKEIPKNMQRRTKRQTRRLLFRSKYRKWLLAKTLMHYQMFPTVEKLRDVLQQDKLPESLISFFAINPYECRSRAYNGEKLSLHELGRVLYHFAQRRGYKESLKNDNEDEGVIYEGSIKDGKAGINETQELINRYGTLGNALYRTDPRITRWRNRYTTRCMYTDEFEVVWEQQQKYYPKLLTDALKQQLGDATEGILFFQRPLKPQSHLIGLCTLEQKEVIKDGKKILVGKQRCSDSCIAFELRRTYEFINSIKVDDRPLTVAQRDTAKELFFSREKFSFADIAAKLKVSIARCNYEENKQVAGTRSIATLRKIFTPRVWDAKTLAEQENILNIKRWAEDKEKTAAYLREKYSLNEKQVQQFLKFKPSKGYSNLSYKATLNLLPFLEKGYIYNEAVWLGGICNALGAEKWQQFQEEKKEDVISNALDIYHNEPNTIGAVQQWLKDEFALQAKDLRKLYHHSIDFYKGDGSLSELPMPENTRNPVVQQALLELRQLVNALINEYGKPDKIRVELSRELKSSREDREAYRLQQFRNEQDNDAIKAILEEYNMPRSAAYLQKLKLYKEIERRAGHVCCPYTGNTIGIGQLWSGEVQVEHIIPYSVCLDDSLANKTLCFTAFNKRKGNRTPYDFFTRELGQEEWKRTKERALTLLPYRKYLRFVDDKPKSLEDFEQRKLNDNRYISRLAKAFLEKVCKQVTVTQGELTAILRHQWGLDSILNPPVHAAGLTEGREYYIAVDNAGHLLQAIPWQPGYKHNRASEEKLAKAGLVLQGIVRNGNIYPYKTRNDHRHHAIDALVVAWTEPRYLQAVATLKGRVDKEEWKNRELSFPEPWPGFFAQARKAISTILVSHKKRTKTVSRVSKLVAYKGKKIRVSGIAVRGALHGETLMGKRKDLYGNQAFHVRKHLSQITKRTQVNKIVDPKIKRLVEQAIIAAWQQYAPDKFDDYCTNGLILPKGNGWVINGQSKLNYEVPEGAFFEVQKDETGRKITGILPRVYLPKGEIEKGVPIHKVRLKENSANAVQLKENRNQWVEPDNNFGVLIYENGDGSLEEKIITFWEAIEAKKQHTPIFALPAGSKSIISTLQANDLFILGLAPEDIDWNNASQMAEHLYRVQKLSSMYYVFRKATAATLDFDAEQKSIRSFKSWQQLNPVKVKIDVLGRITRQLVLVG